MAAALDERSRTDHEDRRVLGNCLSCG
jgi:hypothetical protein